MNSYPAPAKINLHLKITATRPDGYHELDTSFAYVDVCDRLDITPSDQLQVTCSKAELSGENNLVFKVLQALQAQHRIDSGLAVHIDKQLPDQAGLGGGSSDAATAIMAANHLWGLNLSPDALIAFATPYGADIPCFLFGEASMAEGVGEHLLPYPDPLPAGSVLLAYPGSGLSTADVFAHFDAAHRDVAALTPHGTADTIRARRGAGIGENDLEASACALSSDVADLLADMRTVSQQAWMSGSGSSCVALFDDRERAEAESRRLLDRGLASWTHVGRLLGEHPLKQRS